MVRLAALLFMYAETPVHPGGSESLGGIDLPIQRESSTRLPVIWGETAKGALRAFAASPGNAILSPDQVRQVFGSPPPGPGDGPPTAGGWAFGDARLVAFPVPTLRETFAWVTSPLVLERLSRLAALAGVGGLPPDVPRPRADEAVPASQGWQQNVALADVDLEVSGSRDDLALAARWSSWLAESALPRPGERDDRFAYFRSKLRQDLLVVADDVLQLLTEECAEIVPRVQLGADKRVKQGPWYVEYLPAETIMVSYQHQAGPVPDGARWPGLLDSRVVTLGGEETVGKGLVWCRVLAPEAARPGGGQPAGGGHAPA